MGNERTAREPLKEFSFWAFFMGLMLMVVLATGLMVKTIINPCFGFAIIFAYLFAFTFTDKRMGDPSRYWPCTPRLMLGCLLSAMLLIGILMPLIG
jgi:hypothetical protein